MFKKPRSYIGLAIIVFLVILVELSIWIDGQEMFGFITQGFSDSFYFQGNLINGYFISYIIINTLWIHIPILLVFISGDLISGEANNGSLRMILSRPVKRQNLIIAKFISGIVYSSILVILLGVMSTVIGISVFGKGDLIVFGRKLSIIPEKGLLIRFIYAYAFGILSMAVVSSLAFMMSAFSSNSLGPIISSVAIIIGLNIISSFNLPVFNKISPFLFTSYINSWNLFFDLKINTSLIINSIIHLCVNIIVFLSVTLIYFRKKDILS